MTRDVDIVRNDGRTNCRVDECLMVSIPSDSAISYISIPATS